MLAHTPFNTRSERVLLGISSQQLTAWHNLDSLRGRVSSVQNYLGQGSLSHILVVT